FLFFELFYYRAFDLSTLLQAFVPGGLVFFFFVVPSTLLYNRVMERWGVLPWHAVQWAVSFLSCLVFWALAIWVFRVFAV
ncbi:MAG: hypothetical protein JW834_03840, partial [Candidatus Diapherotrites archaeon]|nr:hypothetical protein [Candidatus Diapherotrites archaeon]